MVHGLVQLYLFPAGNRVTVMVVPVSHGLASSLHPERVTVGTASASTKHSSEAPSVSRISRLWTFFFNIYVNTSERYWLCETVSTVRVDEQLSG